MLDYGWLLDESVREVDLPEGHPEGAAPHLDR